MSNSEVIEKRKKRTRTNSLPIFPALGNTETNEAKSTEIPSDGEINSPDAKKSRNDQPKVMDTMDMVNEDLAIVYATEAISKLSIETNDNDIKKLIDCYNPIIDMEMMKKHMLEASESWTDKER